MAPGNVRLPRQLTGLPKDSVANVSQIVAVDKEVPSKRIGKLTASQFELLLSGIAIVLGITAGTSGH
jgi:mRNA interferase MazF